MLLAGCGSNGSEQPPTLSDDSLYATFRDPGNEWRGKPFWSWNGRLEKDELIRQLHVFKEMGMGGAFLHSRVGLKTEYLGPEWFDLTNAVVDEAARLGMEAYLYDEDRWPSGAAGGLVTRDPKFRARHLLFTPEKREAAPYKLSGGQKQRVAIAGVIAMRPDCLVLDEATAMLDPHGRSQVMRTIHQLREAGISIVSITHYMEEAAQADRVLVMSRGRIVMEGTPEEVFSQTQRLHSYHLDVPQAAELRDELVKIGIPMPENVITPDRCAEELYKLLQ